MADLDALEALLAAATPGEWRTEAAEVYPSEVVGGPQCEYGCDGGCDDAEGAPYVCAQIEHARTTIATVYGLLDFAEADAALIVALRNVAPELLAVVRAAERVRGAPMLDSIRELGRALDALRAKLHEIQ